MFVFSAFRRMLVGPRRIVVSALLSGLLPAVSAIAQNPPELARWIAPQHWQRDTDGPSLSLGEKGDFDDTHIFGAAVVKEGDRYFLWYSGSQGFAHDVSGKRGLPDERRYSLGLATSPDGKKFTKHAGGPVLTLEEEGRSILTPSVLRNTDGTPIREDGKLRMWFSTATFGRRARPHSIQSAVSSDGIKWEQVTPDLITRAYCPSVLKDDEGYQMWYTEPGPYPWVIKHARSQDGLKWTVTEKPVLEVAQDWEKFVVVYPSVIKVDGVYLMWYTSYANEDRKTTAIGFAASQDGVHWHKHPQNPVMKSDPERPWESHYNSSGSVIRMPDGSFRMWYFARKKPPFLNLYYSICTARWDGPEKNGPTSRRPRKMKFSATSPEEAAKWRQASRVKVRELLNLTDLQATREPGGQSIPFDVKTLRTEDREKYTWNEIELSSTPHRRIRAILTVPKSPADSKKFPAVVCNHGHGGNRHVVYDRSSIYHGFATELAESGFVTISTDVGQHEVYEQGRTLMGERLWDLIRCVDYLVSRPDVDENRMGCGGLSLGGEMTMWLGAMDPRMKAAVSSGFLTHMDVMEHGHCMCWKFPGVRENFEYCDIYSLIAPRALMCQNGLKETRAAFHVDWARQEMDEIHKAYQVYGAAEKAVLDVHPGGHVFRVPTAKKFFVDNLQQ